MIVSIPYGIYAIAFGEVIDGIISIVINAFPNKKLMNYSVFEQLKDIAPSLGVSIIMGLAVYLLKYLPFEYWVVLIIQILTGMILYWLLSKLFHIESYKYFTNYFLTIVKK